MSKRFTIALLASASALSTFATAPAQAQGAASAATAQDQIETVIVTATKRSEDIQKVAMNVTAIGDTQIKDFKLFTLQDIQAVTPGLIIDSPDGRTNATTVRGIAYNPDSGGAAVLDYYWNETPMSAFSAMKSMYDLGDIEVLKGPQGTLRALSGPGGAILVSTHKPDMNKFEAGINQSVSDRALVNTEAYVNVPLIDDQLALRVAALYHQDRESAVRDLVNGRKNSDLFGSFRASLEWMPTENIDIVLVHQEQRDKSVIYRSVMGDPSGIAAAGSYGGMTGTVITPGDRLAVDYGNADIVDELKLTTLTANINFGSSELISITGWQESYGNFDRSNDTFGTIPGWSQPQVLSSSARTITEELRYQSTGENRFWDYLFGVFYSAGRGQFGLVQDYVNSGAFGLISSPAVFGPPNPAYLSQLSIGGPNNSSRFTIFTDQRIHFWEDNTIEVGVRWTDMRSHSPNTILNISPALMDLNGYGFPMMLGLWPGANSVCTGAIGGVFNYSNGYCDLVIPFGGYSAPYGDPLTHNQAWTGTASFTHQFSDNVMAYFTFGRSWRPSVSANFTPAPSVQPDLLQTGPETSNGYELGTKGTYFGGRLQLNVDIFYQEFKNYINQGGFWASIDSSGYPIDANGAETCSSLAACATTTTPGVGSNFAYVAFGGDANTRGIELQASGIITEGWTASLNAAYARARYAGSIPCNDYNGDGVADSNLAGSSYPGQPSVQPGKNVSLCRVKDPLSNAPPWTISLNSEYDMTIASGIGGYVRGLYSLSPATNDPFGANVHTASRHVVNLYLGVRDDETGRWDVSIWAKNLFDQVGGQNRANNFVYSPPQPTGGSGWDSGYGISYVLPPREVGLTVSYRFGH